MTFFWFVINYLCPSIILRKRKPSSVVRSKLETPSVTRSTNFFWVWWCKKYEGKGIQWMICGFAWRFLFWTNYRSTPLVENNCSEINHFRFRVACTRRFWDALMIYLKFEIYFNGPVLEILLAKHKKFLVDFSIQSRDSFHPRSSIIIESSISCCSFKMIHKIYWTYTNNNFLWTAGELISTFCTLFIVSR